MELSLVNRKVSTLTLIDGKSFSGKSFGAEKAVAGEVVFNTGMVGYPEALTDPSYCGQILILTYPLIGNYGVPKSREENGLDPNFESSKIQVRGLIISDLSENYSHWNSELSLHAWLKEQDVPGLHAVDTRALTKRLRSHGVMLGRIGNADFEDPNTRNLVADVSAKEKIVYNQNGNPSILLIDCGAKNNIIRSLVTRGAKVIRVPWDYNFFSEKFEGIVISNGPGDPKMADATVKNVKRALEKEIPTFGICLGNQILALAAGGETYKLKFGHRSQNQPCIDTSDQRCYITSQNHGYAVDPKSLPEGWQEWFRNANDNTNEGLRHKTKPFMSVQFHPEASPGPVDTNFLFDKFLDTLK